MTIANCPRCEEQVRVPAGVSADATVQCPLCREEYSLAEPLRKLPPELLVVDDMSASPVDDADIEGSWDTAEEAPDEAQPASEFAFAPVDAGDATSAFDFDNGSASGASPISNVRSSARRAKPKGSPMKSVLAIVIGGMMAFPIAQLILWYLPGNLKRDFGAGPVVAKYIPAIVPAKFRGTAANSDDSESVIPEFDAGEFSFDNNSQTSGGNGQNGNKRRNNKKPPAEENSSGNGFELPETEGAFTAETINAEPITGEPTEEGPEPVAPGVPVPEFNIGPLPTATTDVPAEPAKAVDTVGPVVPTKETRSANPDAPDPRPEEERETPTLEVGSLRGARPYSSSEVADSFSKAQAVSTAWDMATEPAKMIELRQPFYESMSHLGQVLAFTNDGSEDKVAKSPEIRRLLIQIGRQHKKVQSIGEAQAVWIKWPHKKRGTDGVCIHGTVASVEQHGELFETVVESNGWSVPVITRDDPSDTITVGKQVLVLGAIVPTPAARLGGYKGDAKVVILSGLHAAIESE
ncbi:MAG: hypothetical protein CMJ64_19935 [Planctomycetaceae bacterium]|jgi:hypothetical protein|nr:hypothetical protein [Planctomycetaceae bacterium]